MPGASFGEGVSTYVSPDVFVYKVDGEFLIVLNEDGLPNLHLSPVYDNASENASSKEKEYFNEKIRSAAWLIKSLHQVQAAYPERHRRRYQHARIHGQPHHDQ